MRYTSIRVLLALVAQMKLELKQSDIKITFLHGVLKEEIYMTRPEGFVAQGNKNYLCNFKKSLYMLKQSASQWYKHFDLFMVSHGYSRSHYDCCKYHKEGVNGSRVFLLLYVDDTLVASQYMANITRVKQLLNYEFDMKDLGTAQKTLGMEIIRDKSR